MYRCIRILRIVCPNYSAPNHCIHGKNVPIMRFWLLQRFPPNQIPRSKVISRHWKCQFVYTNSFFFNLKFYPDARELRQNENWSKTVNTILIGITTLIHLWYLEVKPFCLFFNPSFKKNNPIPTQSCKIAPDSNFLT